MNDQLSLFEESQAPEIEPSIGKFCIACKIFKEFKFFSKHTGHKDNHDGRCRECVNAQVRLRKNLKKNAPPKPNICDCCEKPSDDIVLDHCHVTHSFRGWLCRTCNAGIGLLDDSLEGVEKAVVYLRESDERY